MMQETGMWWVPKSYLFKMQSPSVLYTQFQPFYGISHQLKTDQVAALLFWVHENRNIIENITFLTFSTLYSFLFFCA
jgi:hypothetical protein